MRYVKSFTMAAAAAALAFASACAVGQTAAAPTAPAPAQQDAHATPGAKPASPPAASPSFGAAAMQMLLAPQNGKREFLLHFTPPRASFATDMTPEETQTMMAQVLYWNTQMKSGNVLLLGAVNGNTGIYGMAVVECATEAEARALAAADPSVKAGMNKVDVSPMRVLLRK